MTESMNLACGMLVHSPGALSVRYGDSREAIAAQRHRLARALADTRKLEGREAARRARYHLRSILGCFPGDLDRGPIARAEG
jgi:hypothetical protein